MFKCATRFVMAKVLVLVSALAASAHDFTQEGVHWRTELYPAYLEACREGKPLIVYVHVGYCENCRGICQTRTRLESEALRSKAFLALDHQAIFVWQDAEKDDSHGNVHKLLSQLKIDRSPTVVVLAVSPDKIVEADRIVGYYPTEEFLRRLRPALNQAAHTDLRDDGPRAAPAPVPAVWSAESTVGSR